MQSCYPSTPRRLYTDRAGPATPDSPSFEKESHIGSEAAARQVREAADDVLRDYEEKRDRLAKGIDSSMYLLGDIRNFNGEQWTVRYPHIRSEVAGQPSLPHRPAMGKRTLTSEEPSSIESTPSVRITPKRASTLARALPEEPELAEGFAEDFSILRLDLNMGAVRHAKGLITHLEKSSISSLLDNRLAASLDHLALLRKRIFDAQSRVLVTGDLNAGKSTLINALLRRNEVMPTDQQPLTTRFVEVVSARENEGREEIHILDQEGKYDPADQSTYTAVPIEKLEVMATDMDTDASSPPLRVFLREAPTNVANPSILHNGVVDISLIDAPGLNRDSIKTTANFARQEEIDVVVFVVSAANHFTLSAKEFIWQAGHEKAHLFIVVNRFDQIKDRERCRRAVLEQIKQLSPKTYEDAADLVHFVDSAKVAFGVSEDDSSDLDEAFCYLEHSLRSFVLVNRAKSKLGPAQNYVTHLLADLEMLAVANSHVAMQERDAARDELARVKPVLETMRKGKEGLEESLVAEEDRATGQASSSTKAAMKGALERVAQGEPAVALPGLELPSFPGLLGVWDYAKEIKNVLLSSLDVAASQAETDARKVTAEAVDRVVRLGDKHLPTDVERSQRVFNPNAMFSPRRLGRRQSGVNALGLGLASHSQLAEVNISDIFDLQHQIFLARSSLPATSSSELVPFSTELSGLGFASLAVGALSLSTKTLGLNAIIDGIVRISELVSNPAARRWAGPIVGVVAFGAVAYVVYDLPRSIPRNVGRHLQASLLISSGVPGDDEHMPWAEYQASRVGKEVRKVMRLAAWDQRERFRGAVDARGQVVKESEEMEKRASRALEWFEDVGKQVERIRNEVGLKV